MYVANKLKNYFFFILDADSFSVVVGTRWLRVRLPHQHKYFWRKGLLARGNLLPAPSIDTGKFPNEVKTGLVSSNYKNDRLSLSMIASDLTLK